MVPYTCSVYPADTQPRKRRIKCDERRPSCTQCERSNKLCTGYPPPSRSDRPLTDVRIAPKPLATAQPLAVQGHTPGIVFRAPTVLPPRRANRRKRPVVPVLHPGAIGASPSVYQPLQVYSSSTPKLSISSCSASKLLQSCRATSTQRFGRSVSCKNATQKMPSGTRWWHSALFTRPLSNRLSPRLLHMRAR